MTEPVVQTSDLKSLLNIPTSLKIADRIIELTPLRFGELARTIELAGPLLAELGDPNNRWIDLVMRHADRLVPLTAHLSRQPPDFIEKLDLDAAADLLGRCLVVNADFFARKVGPALVRLMVGLTGVSPPNPAPPQASAAPATGPTSSGS